MPTPAPAQQALHCERLLQERAGWKVPASMRWNVAGCRRASYSKSSGVKVRGHVYSHSSQETIAVDQG